jgi:hypothetical protein
MYSNVVIFSIKLPAWVWSWVWSPETVWSAGFGLFPIFYYFTTGGHRPRRFNPDFVVSNTRLRLKYRFPSTQRCRFISPSPNDVHGGGWEGGGTGGIEFSPIHVVCLDSSERPMLTTVVVIPTGDVVENKQMVRV